ncbi:MAG: DUF11 domain-containing protein [Planctomycetales bacterium]|nr:DUF11 domain-containing protein [Planctomycetales bacterium]
MPFSPLRKFARLFSMSSSGRQSRRRTRRPKLSVEGLELRRVLATDFGGIEGFVFNDLDDDGVKDAGEAGIAGATIQLAGTNDLGSSITQSAVTDANGRYRFESLRAGSYQLTQVPIANFNIRTGSSPQTRTITATEAQGESTVNVDGFNQTRQLISVEGGVSTSANESVAAPEAVGGNRELSLDLISATGTAQFGAFVGGDIGLTLFNSDTATSRGVVRWDAGDSVNGIVPSVDVTNDNAEYAVVLSVSSDEPNGDARITFESSGATSVATMAISDTGGINNPEELLIRRSSFSNQTLPQSTDAIELQLDGGPDFDGRIFLVDIIATNFGPQQINFANTQGLNLALTKTVNDDTPNVGDQVAFTLNVTNQGPSDATNVQVTDQLPAGLTHVSNTPSQGTYNSTNGVWSVGSLANGASANLVINASVNSLGKKTNNASITGVDQDDTNAADNAAMAMVTPEEVNLSITKSVNDDTPNVNDTVTFTVNVTNEGPSNATNVQVTDQLPAGLTHVSSTTSQGTYNSTSGIWTVGSLANQGSASLQVNASVDTTVKATNTATISGVDQAETTTADNTAMAMVTPESLNLSVVKGVSNSMPLFGSDVTFSMTVTNQGPSAATNVTYSDVLPAGLTFVSANATAGSYSSSTGQWTIGSMANSASETLTVVATVNTTSKVTNTITLGNVDQTDSNAADNTASAMVMPQTVPLTLTKRSFLASAFR